MAPPRNPVGNANPFSKNAAAPFPTVKPPKPKPTPKPKTGPYSKGYKPPKPKAAPKSSGLGVSARAPSKNEEITVTTDQRGKQHVTRAPITQPHEHASWPNPYLKPSLQTRSAQKILQGKNGHVSQGDLKRAQRAGEREIAGFQFRRTHVKDPYSNTWRPKFAPSHQGALDFAADPIVGVAKGVYSGAAHRVQDMLGIHPGDRGLYGVAHEGGRPTPGVPGFAKPLMPLGRTTHGLANLTQKGAEAYVGPDLLSALGGGHFTPWKAGLDAAALFPFFKAAKGLEGAVDLGRAARYGEEAATARKAFGRANPAPRVINIGGIERTGPASRSGLLPHIQRLLDKHTQAWIDAHPTSAMHGLKNAPKWVRLNVQNLTKTTQHYGNRAQRAVAELLNSRVHSEGENLALHLIGTDTPGSVYATHLDKAIAEQEARLRRAENRMAGASDKELKKLRKNRARAQRAIGDLNHQKEVLPEARSHLRDVRADSLRGTPYESGAAGHELVPVPNNKGIRAGLHDTFLLHKHVDEQRVQRGKQLTTTVGGKKVPRLTDEVVAGRLSAPGRVYRGGRWGPGEETLPQGLMAQKRKVDALENKLAKAEAALEKEGGKPISRARFDPKTGKPLARGAYRKVEKKTAKQFAVERYRGLVSDAKTKLQTLEKGHVTRTGKHPRDYYGKQAGIQGAEHFTGGKVYIPSGFEEVGRGAPGTYKAGEVLPKTMKPPPGFGGRYTGELALRGAEDMNVPQVAARSALGMQRSHMGETHLAELQKHAVTGEDVPENLSGWQAVRVGEPDRQSKADLEKALDDLHSEQKLSRKTRRELENRVHARANEWYDKQFPTATKKSHLDEQEEYGFVPKELVGDRAYWESMSKFGHAINTASGVMKKAVVYTKVGHIPVRFLSNGGFIMGQQGWRIIPTSIKASQFTRKYPQLARAMEVHSGQGSFGAIATDPLEKALVHPVERYADLPWRRTAMVYEIQKDAGRNMTVDEIAQRWNELTHAPPGSDLAKRLEHIDQRAAVHAGEYNRMSPIERRFISKVLFLWAWHRTAAVTAGKFALEHPVAAAGVGGGLYYMNNVLNAGRPPWQSFSTPGPGGTIMNWATSMPTSTPVEDLKTLIATGKAIAQHKPPAFGEGLAGDLNPVFQTALESLLGFDIQTGHPLKENALLTEARRTPPGALAGGKGPFWQRAGKYFLGNPFPQTPSSAGGTDPLKGIPPELLNKMKPSERKKLADAIREAEKQRKEMEKKADAALKKAGLG